MQEKVPLTDLDPPFANLFLFPGLSLLNNSCESSHNEIGVMTSLSLTASSYGLPRTLPPEKKFTFAIEILNRSAEQLESLEVHVNALNARSSHHNQQHLMRRISPIRAFLPMGMNPTQNHGKCPTVKSIQAKLLTLFSSIYPPGNISIC